MSKKATQNSHVQKLKAKHGKDVKNVQSNWGVPYPDALKKATARLYHSGKAKQTEIADALCVDFAIISDWCRDFKPSKRKAA